MKDNWDDEDEEAAKSGTPALRSEAKERATQPEKEEEGEEEEEEEGSEEEESSESDSEEELTPYEKAEGRIMVRTRGGKVLRDDLLHFKPST